MIQAKEVRQLFGYTSFVEATTRKQQAWLILPDKKENVPRIYTYERRCDTAESASNIARDGKQ